MVIRFAKENELIRVNELRKQVNDLHVEGKSEIFKAGFNKELQDHVYTIWKDLEQKIIVAESEGMICGFAVLHHIHKPETPFMQERDFMDIDEFCVDKKYRRQGIASALTSKLAIEILERGKVPFYCCAWSNIKSARNAIKSGFRPAWAQMTVKPLEMINEMNGIK